MVTEKAMYTYGRSSRRQYDMRMCTTMITIKITSLRIDTKVQATTLSFFNRVLRQCIYKMKEFAIHFWDKSI